MESCTATNGLEGENESTVKLIEDKLVALCVAFSHTATVVKSNNLTFWNQTNKVIKQMLFNKKRQYNIHDFNNNFCLYI